MSDQGDGESFDLEDWRAQIFDRIAMLTPAERAEWDEKAAKFRQSILDEKAHRRRKADAKAARKRATKLRNFRKKKQRMLESLRRRNAKLKTRPKLTPREDALMRSGTVCRFLMVFRPGIKYLSEDLMKALGIERPSFGPTLRRARVLGFVEQEAVMETGVNARCVYWLSEEGEKVWRCLQ